MAKHYCQVRAGLGPRLQRHKCQVRAGLDLDCYELTSFSESIALSASTAKLSNDVLSGVVAKCARIDAGICLIKACRITALPTTAVVPNPAVFCRRRRKREGISVGLLSFSPDITIFTRPGVVKPRLSINTLLRLIYLWLRNGCSKISLTSDATSPDRAAQVSLYCSSSSVMSWRSNWVSPVG